MSKRVALLLVYVVCLLRAASASASFAPPSQPGPPLSVPPAQLNAALSCWGSLGASAREPILLVPGTTLNPETDFSWGWEPGGMVPR